MLVDEEDIAEIKHTFFKYKSEREKLPILLMITNREKWHCGEVTRLSALFGGINFKSHFIILIVLIHFKLKMYMLFTKMFAKIISFDKIISFTNIRGLR